MVPVVNNVHSRYGFPDEVFEQRTPLVGQITKKEIRAVSIHSLGLRPDSVLWDIGSGSGSVARVKSYCDVRNCICDREGYEKHRYIKKQC